MDHAEAGLAQQTFRLPFQLPEDSGVLSGQIRVIVLQGMGTEFKGAGGAKRYIPNGTDTVGYAGTSMWLVAPIVGSTQSTGSARTSTAANAIASRNFIVNLIRRSLPCHLPLPQFDGKAVGRRGAERHVVSHGNGAVGIAAKDGDERTFACDRSAAKRFYAECACAIGQVESAHEHSPIQHHIHRRHSAVAH